MARSNPRSKRTTTTAKRRLEFGDDHHQDVNRAVVVENGSEANSPADKEDNIKGLSSIVWATPEKKRRRRDDRNNKEGIGMYFSPSKTTTSDRRKTSVMVTPEKKKEENREKETKDRSQYQQHVPIYIHKNLNYQRRGQAILSEKLKRAFDLVEEHYVVPFDFESDQSFGPLSGTCFEERVVNAYDRNLLLPNQPSYGGGILICAQCAKLGHRQDDCPDLI